MCCTVEREGDSESESESDTAAADGGVAEGKAADGEGEPHTCSLSVCNCCDTTFTLRAGATDGADGDVDTTGAGVADAGVAEAAQSVTGTETSA